MASKIHRRGLLFIAKINTLLSLSTHVFISGMVDYREVKQIEGRIYRDAKQRINSLSKYDTSVETNSDYYWV